MNAPNEFADPTASLFENRVPEAAARQLACVLAWLAEQQLQALEKLEARRSTPARDVMRQRAIVATTIAHCADLGVPPRGLRGDSCPRLAAALARVRANGGPSFKIPAGMGDAALPP